MRMLRCDNLLSLEAERADKRVAQLRQKVQRAAQEGDIAPDGLSAGKTADGLVDNRLENRGSQVFARGAFVNQRLDIRLGKYAAAGGNRINRLIICRICIQSGCVRLEERCHLIDKRSGASCTDSVHPLINAVGKVNNFCILAAQFDGDIGMRGVILKCSGDGDNLLHKIYGQVPGERKSAGTGNGGNNLQRSKSFFCFFQQTGQGFLNVGVMPLVVREKKTIVWV